MARDFASGNTDSVSWSGGPFVLSSTAASILCWFKHGTHTGLTADNAFFFDQRALAAKRVSAFLQGVDGKISVAWRADGGTGANASFISTSAWDDGAPHRLLLVRRSVTPFIELYIDEASDGSSATDPGTDATATTAQRWGGNAQAANGGFGGTLGRCQYVAGVTLTPKEAAMILWRGRTGRKMSQWLEMGIASPEPDWSGNGLSGTLSGTSISGGLYQGSPFG